MYNTIKWEKEMKTPVGTLLVIDPIHIYSVVAPFVYEVVKETEKSVEDLQLELNQLQNKVLEQNQKNRILLKQHMDVIREQLANFNNPYATMDVIAGMEAYMKRMGVTDINELIGKVK